MKGPFDREEEKPDEDPEHQSTEEAVAEHIEKVGESKEEAKPPEYVPPPVTTRIDVTSVFPEKRAAIQVHRTQFAPDGLFTTMPEDIALVASGEEHYSPVSSRVPVQEQEDDLLAGLD